MKKAAAVFCGSSKPENNSLIDKEVNKLAELLIEKKNRIGLWWR